MFDAATGWAETSTSLLRTTDGWRNWADVTPHRAALLGAGYFLTSAEAWIGEASGLSAPAGQQPAVVVSHTTDGGRTWQPAAIPVAVPEGIFSMSFIGERDGWCEAAVGGSAGTDLVEILRTTDGGQSWSAVSDFPQSGHKTGLVFVNATTGWATSAGLYVTHDAGVTWRAQPLPDPPGDGPASAGLPTFFGDHDGLLPAGTKVLVTHDGGTTWQPVPGSSLPPQSGLVTFLELEHGWAAAAGGPALYRTEDGGAHWAELTPAIAAGIAGIVDLNFTSAEVGWALGSSDNPQDTQLFETTDGGTTWTRIPLVLPRT
jgi:photosystem II stability/assembly factor-like uncharacterized protein